MRSLAVIMVLFAVVVCSCREKTYTCHLSYYHVPASVDFTGFTAAELDTIVVAEYAPGAAFSTPLRTDKVNKHPNGNKEYPWVQNRM